MRRRRSSYCHSIAIAWTLVLVSVAPASFGNDFDDAGGDSTNSTRAPIPPGKLSSTASRWASVNRTM